MVTDTPASINCIFCKIIVGELPCKKVYENDLVLAFDDINPIAPVHVLVVPKKHIVQLDDCEPGDLQMMGAVMLAAGEVAKIKGVAESGYRVTANNGRDGGQEVFHLHAHVLAGRRMRGLG